MDFFFISTHCQCNENSENPCEKTVTQCVLRNPQIPIALQFGLLTVSWKGVWSLFQELTKEVKNEHTEA